MDFIRGIKDYLGSTSELLGAIDANPIERAIRAILDAYESKSRIYIFGNGGSATTAEHLTCDFNKCLSSDDGCFDVACLSSDMAAITAYANDCGYENIFVNQLSHKMKKGDLVICISGSGNSPNVINAAKYAKVCGNKVITMTGHSGGQLIGLSDCAIHVPSDDQQKVEDCHLMIGHLMLQIVGKAIGHPIL